MTNLVTQLGVLLAIVTTGVSGTSSIDVTTPSLGFPQSLQQLWGHYAPWFAVTTYASPPEGCKITQVVVLERHGARYPTSGSGKDIQDSVEQLQKATSFNNPNLTFVQDYTYDLDNNGYLVPFGAAESYDAGEAAYVRYASLVNKTMLPFIRATDSERVVASAGNWSAGFAYASNQKYTPPVAVIISESSNDTLDDNMCPNAGSSSSETTAWADVFTPEIVNRFNTEAPGANLSSSDIVNLMSLCPFDTVANEAPSPWCNLFNSTEWASYEYYGDLGYYYGNGYGQELGPVQGVGWVNELLARLTGQPVQDETQTNSTLDDNPATFPLNRTIYADFSHDNEMISIYCAIGLFEQSEPLDPTEPNPARTWVGSLMTPFAGRLVTEKLSCDGSGSEGQGTYVRMLVNDALQPLTFCGASGNGLCTLDNFVESQSFARNNGDGLWPLCSS